MSDKKSNLFEINSDDIVSPNEEVIKSSPSIKRYSDRINSQLSFSENIGLSIAPVYKAVKRKVTDELPMSMEELEISYENSILDVPGVDLLNNAIKLGAAIDIITDAEYEKRVDPNLDRRAVYEQVTSGVPEDYHEDLLSYGNLSDMLLAKQRVIEKVQKQRLIEKQHGFKFTRFMSMMVDVDFALIPFGMGVASKGRHAYKGVDMLSKNILKDNLKSGMINGTASGALLGGLYSSATDGAGVDDALLFTVLGTTTGGILGATTGLIGQAFAKKYMQMGDEFVNTANKGKGDLYSGPPLLEGTVEAPIPMRDVTPGRLERDLLPQEAAEIRGGIFIEGTSKPVTKRRGSDGKPLRNDVNVIIDNAIQWQKDTDFLARRQKDLDNKGVKILMSPIFSRPLGNALNNKAFTNPAATVNWTYGNIMESSSGLNRAYDTASAAATMESFVLKASESLGDVYKQQLKALNFVNEKTGINKSVFLTRKDEVKINRDLILHRNNLAMGREGTQNPGIIELSKSIDNSMNTLYKIESAEGLDISKSVAGFENKLNSFREHYYPVQWTNKIGNYIRSAPDNLKADMTKAFVKGLAKPYMALNPSFTEEIAEAVANAVIKRSLSQSSNINLDMSLSNLLTTDGKAALRVMLEESGLSENKINSFMDKFKTPTDKAKPGYAKRRVDIDLAAEINLPGVAQPIQIVDLIDNNILTVLHRRIRNGAGRAALARKGLRSIQDEKKLISAMMKEQDFLKVPKNEQISELELIAHFSHFKGAATQGYGKILSSGKLESQGPLVSLAKSGVQLGYLNQQLFVQGLEFGNVIGHIGLISMAERMIKPMFASAYRQHGKKVLEEIAVFSGNLGYDHKFLVPHRMLDELNSKERGKFMDKAIEYSGNLKYIQGYTSLFNVIKGLQQRITAIGYTDRLFRTLHKSLDKNGNLVLSKKDAARLLDSFNIGPKRAEEYADLIRNNIVKMKKSKLGYVFTDSLQPKLWSKELADDFGASMHMRVNQSVQKSLAGEQDPFIFTNAGSIMFNLVTFPAQALNKQALRQLRLADSESVLNLLLGLSIATGVSYIKDYTNGKEGRTTAEHVARGVAYSNILGWVPMYTNYLGTITGAEFLRFNNRYTDQAGLTPVSLKYGEDLLRILPALSAGAMGTADFKDRRSMAALPYYKTVGVGSALDKLVTRNISKEEEKNILGEFEILDGWMEDTSTLPKDLYDDLPEDYFERLASSIIDANNY